MSRQLITGKMSLVGLMGWPVGHSLSPAMHNAAFNELGMDWLYLLFPVRPGEVEQALKGLVALNFVGCNVTVPHKEAAKRAADELSESARIIGAVNCIHIQEGRLFASNTDATGFSKSLQEAGCHPQGMRVAVLGAGGSSRAVVYALARAGAESVVVINRTLERAAVLVEDMADLFPGGALRFEPRTREAFVKLGDKVDLVVNTTSMGMVPHVTACPWPEDVPMPANAFYYDLVYNPLETVFLARARAVGATGVDGLGMLLHQGVAAFEMWTGQPAPLEVMRQALYGQASQLGAMR